MAPMIMDVHTGGCEAMFTSVIRRHAFPRGSGPAWCLYCDLADAWGTAPRRSTMSRPIVRSLLGAVAASLLIAAAGACTRDNPSNPNRPGGSTGGNAGGSTGTTGGTGTGPTAGGGNPNGGIPAPPCKVDSDCSSGLVCNVGHCVAACDATTNPCQANQTCTNGRCYENGGNSCGTGSV